LSAGALEGKVAARFYSSAGALDFSTISARARWAAPEIFRSCLEFEFVMETANFFSYSIWKILGTVEGF
jgi:hypothetical protein